MDLWIGLAQVSKCLSNKFTPQNQLTGNILLTTSVTFPKQSSDLVTSII